MLEGAIADKSYCAICAQLLGLAVFGVTIQSRRAMAKATGDDLPDPDLKIILLGDSAVGKSKLIERFLMDEYNPRQVGVRIFRYTCPV